jgi:hypothetical protein
MPKAYVTHHHWKNGRHALGTVAHLERGCPARKFRGHYSKLSVVEVEGELASILLKDSPCKECVNQKQSKKEARQFVKTLTEDDEKCDLFGCTNPIGKSGTMCDTCYRDYLDDPDAFK